MMSPKAYAKLFVVPSLAELTAHGVSLRGMDLSIATLLEEAAAVRPAPPPGPALGTLQWGFSALSSAVGAAASYWQGAGAAAAHDAKPSGFWAQDADAIVAEAGGVPAVLDQLGRAIQQHCTDTEGIFRRAGSSAVLPGLRSVLDAPAALQPKLDWALVAEHDPLLPPTLLKRLLAHVAEPIVPPEAYAAVRAAHTPADVRDVFLPALSPGRAALLSHTVHVLHGVLAHEERTRMGARGLAITLAPTLLRGPDARIDAALCLPPGQAMPGLPAPEGQTLTGLLELWIERWDEVGVPDGATPPVSLPLGSQRRSAPASPVTVS